jgi:hypothetical protein
MKRRDRDLSLKAARIHKRRGGPNVDVLGIAKRLKVEPHAVAQILNRGLLIEQCEAHRLTDNEMVAMTVLARLEARRVHLGGPPPTIGEVDHAAGKRSGWTGKVVQRRLRTARPTDAGVRDITNRLGFIAYPNDAGSIWLTPAGWAFVWATGLILKNWKVPG